MRWPESLKQPEWITAVGTLVLVVLTMLILVLTFLLIPDDRWNSFLHYLTWTVAIPLLIVGGLVTAAVYNFRTAVLKVTQQQSRRSEITGQLSALFQRGQW